MPARMQTPSEENRVSSRVARAAARRHARRRTIASIVVVGGLVCMGGTGVWALATRRSQPASTTPIAGAGSTTGTPAQLEPAVARPTSGGQASDSSPTSASAQARRPATITVSAVGDMIFDRRVKALIAAKGGRAPLADVATRLARADIALGNLESSLSRSGSPQPGKDVTFRGDPRGIAGLKAAGFDFVALGNNHVLDYGPISLRDTLTGLDGARIGHSGAGMNRSAAWKPAVATRDGATVAFLSFSHIVPANFVATDSRAGLARSRGNMDKVASAIKAAKKRYDYVVVSFHWGIEYKDFANADQVRDGRRAVDAGADMVLSHHPHVIQGIEFYKGRLIAYSLGDFVFDHYSRKTGEAFILDAKLGPSGVTNVVATPVYLDGNGAPAVVTGAEATVILKRLKQVSAPHGTNVRLVGSTARVSR